MDTEYFFIRYNKKYIRINVNEVNYIEGLKDYVILFTNSMRYIIAMNIKTICSQLDQNVFLRINKSIIINVDKISEIEKNKIYLLNSEKVLLIGDGYRTQFNEFLQKKILKRQSN